MRIAHRDAGDIIISPADAQGVVYHALGAYRGGYVLSLKRCPAHIDRHGADFSVPCVQTQTLYAAAGLDIHILRADIALVVEIFAHTAQVVAGYLTLAAVAVERAHPRVCGGGFFDKHDAVTADAVMRRAQADAQAFGAGYGAVEVFDEDIVVARALHLGEADFLLPAPHRVYIDKLGILLVEAACDDLRKSVCRVKARQAGYAELHRTAVQGDIVAHGGILDGAGIDDIAEPSAFHEAGYLIALGCVCHRCYLYAELRYRVCGSARGIQAQAEVIQPLCK